MFCISSHAPYFQADVVLQNYYLLVFRQNQIKD